MLVCNGAAVVCWVAVNISPEEDSCVGGWGALPVNISPEEDSCVGGWGALPVNISPEEGSCVGGWGALPVNVKLVLEVPKLNDGFGRLVPNVLAVVLEAVNEKPDVFWDWPLNMLAPTDCCCDGGLADPKTKFVRCV